jgi:hypothetical protein
MQNYSKDAQGRRKPPPGKKGEKIDESSHIYYVPNLLRGIIFGVEKNGTGPPSPRPRHPHAQTGLGGGEGGAILRAQQKKDFGAIPYFLVIADTRKLFSM